MTASLEFPCPKCRAPKSVACHAPTGRGVPPHKERLDVAGTPHRSKGKSACQKWLDDHAGYEGDDCLIWPFSGPRGYGHFKCNGKRSYAHRYMCTLIHGDPPSDKHQASHSCGRGHEGCVHPLHLSWKTQSENQLDRRIHGTTKRNGNGWAGKVTMAQAEEIRRLASTKTQDDLAEMFDTSRGNIQFILNGQTKLKVLGLERQRILTVLSKAGRPMSYQEIKAAARLVTLGATQNMMKRMADAGIIVRLGRGRYSTPTQTPGR
jgi:hypothetical protein